MNKVVCFAYSYNVKYMLDLCVAWCGQSSGVTAIRRQTEPSNKNVEKCLGLDAVGHRSSLANSGAGREKHAAV